MNYEIKSAKEANVHEIFFDKTAKKLSFKTSLGIAVPLATIDDLANNTASSDYTETIVTIEENITSYSDGRPDVNTGILSMGTSPIELLPNAGVGKYYDIDKIILEYQYGTAQYVSPDLVMTSSGTTWAFIYSQYNFLSGDQDFWTKVVQPCEYNSTDQITVSYSELLNKNLLLTTYTEVNPTGGDGRLRVKIYYKTNTFGA
jgi:hypothetical protein